jgi:hypothetical protein
MLHFHFKIRSNWQTFYASLISVNFGIKLLFLIHHTVSYNNLIVETVIECFITFISKLDKLSYILYFNLFLFGFVSVALHIVQYWKSSFNSNVHPYIRYETVNKYAVGEGIL